MKNDKIVCDLAAGTTSADSTTGGFQKGQGVEIKRYLLSEMEDNDLTDSGVNNSAEFYTAIKDNTLEAERLIENKVIGTWETSFESNYNQGVEGIHA